MDEKRINESLSKIIFVLIILFTFITPSCITIEVPSNTDSRFEPYEPSAVRKMKALGYSFTFYPDDDPYWEARNSYEGWTFRVFDNDSFGMSGQFDKDYDAQTEASIDFFESLGITPSQAELTVEITIEAMANTDRESSGCYSGLCCTAQVVESQKLYLWYCERQMVYPKTIY